MEKFAFIIHPLDKQDLARKYKIANYLPMPLVERIALGIDPKPVSHITGIRSATGTELEGWFVGVPVFPRQCINKSMTEVVTKKIAAGARVAQDLGAGVVGLGAYTSVAGDAGITVAQSVDIAVTTGNSYTIYTAVEGLLKAAALLEVDVAAARAAVIGATGSIGKVCSQMLGNKVQEVCLVGRDAARLDAGIAEIGDGPYRASTDVSRALQQADLIVAVSSAVDAIIHPRDLKPGAIVCDVARPRDVSVAVARERPDVLVIEGGVVEVPGDVEFNFDFGFPPKTAYACMSETMLLALEGMYTSYTLGRDITLEQVETMGNLAAKHGFRLAGFRSFEKAVTDAQIAAVRKAVHTK